MTTIDIVAWLMLKYAGSARVLSFRLADMHRSISVPL